MVFLIGNDSVGGPKTAICQKGTLFLTKKPQSSWLVNIVPNNHVCANTFDSATTNNMTVDHLHGWCWACGTAAPPPSAVLAFSGMVRSQVSRRARMIDVNWTILQNMGGW